MHFCTHCRGSEPEDAGPEVPSGEELAEDSDHSEDVGQHHPGCAYLYILPHCTCMGAYFANCILAVGPSKTVHTRCQAFSHHLTTIPVSPSVPGNSRLPDLCAAERPQLRCPSEINKSMYTSPGGIVPAVNIQWKRYSVSGVSRILLEESPPACGTAESRCEHQNEPGCDVSARTQEEYTFAQLHLKVNACAA